MSRLLNIANIERGGYRLHDIFAKASYDIYWFLFVCLDLDPLLFIDQNDDNNL